MQSANVMVVEDERIVAVDIKNSLKDLGYKVPAVASSGSDAIELASELRPDIVLMDIMLAGSMDGIETARELRNKFNIPVIYLTAYTDDNTLQRAKLTEPYGYLLKPFEEMELQTSIEVAIYKHRSELEEKQKMGRAHMAATELNDGLWEWEKENGAIYLSPSGRALIGFDLDEKLNELEDWLKILHPSDIAIFKQNFERVFDGHVSRFNCEFRLVKKEGGYVWVRMKAIALNDRSGRLVRILGDINDISIRKTAEETLTHYAFTDPLTELSNRISFLDILGREMRKSYWKKDESFSLFYINIIGFSKYNFRYGYQGGDEILMQVAERLKELFYENAFLSRLGGDNFVILCQKISQKTQAKELAEKLIDLLETKIIVQDEEVNISIAIGICLRSDKFSFPEEFLLCSEKTMQALGRGLKSEYSII